MSKRHKMGRKRSGKLFTKTARRTNKRNLGFNPMRGGFRM